MPNTLEDSMNSLEASLKGEVAAVEPEELIEEETAAEVEVAKEESPQEPVENENEGSEGVEQEVDEEGRIVVNFDDEGETETQVDDIKSLKEQVKLLLEEKKKLESNSQIDPRIAKLNDFVKNGGEINQAVWELQSKDYSNVDVKNVKDAVSAMRDKLKYIDGLDADEVEFYIEQNYPIAGGFEDDPDEDDQRKEALKLRMDARKELPTLKEFQDKVRLPEVDHNKQAEYEKAVTMYRAESSSKLDEIESFDLELDADTKLKIPFTGAAKNFVRSIVTEPENQANFFTNRYSKEGKVDWKLFTEEMHFLENKSRIINAAYKQGQSSGKKSILEEIKEEGTTRKTVQKREAVDYGGLENVTFKRF